MIDHDARHLDWDGCLNARDLGGLPTLAGGETRRGAVVRSDNPAYLTAAGWAALHRHGVRTVVALRTAGTTDDEPAEAALPAGVALERVVVEDLGDATFVRECVDTGRWCTPVYFRPVLERWPAWCAAGVAAVARAAPGGVVVSCGRGCDRTGLVSFLLLALVGVTADAIAADWSLSIDRVRPRHPDIAQELATVLAREETTVVDVVRDTLAAVDVEAQLRRGGLDAADLASVRRRLLGTS